MRRAISFERFILYRTLASAFACYTLTRWMVRVPLEATPLHLGAGWVGLICAVSLLFGFLPRSATMLFVLSVGTLAVTLKALVLLPVLLLVLPICLYEELSRRRGQRKQLPILWAGLFLVLVGGSVFIWSDQWVFLAAFLPVLVGCRIRWPQGPEKKIVYFDGFCGLCDSTVNHLLSMDERHTLKFCALQHALEGKIPEDLRARLEDQDTIVYERGEHFLTRSTAMLWILFDIGGIWKIFILALLIPSPWRDSVYRVVARNRYVWFQRRQECRLPSPEEEAQFVL